VVNQAQSHNGDNTDKRPAITPYYQPDGKKSGKSQVTPVQSRLSVNNLLAVKTKASILGTA
jgi:hypothetical protein